MVSTAVIVPATPTAKVSAPAISAFSGATGRMASEPSTPVPLSARISRLPTTWLSMAKTPATSDGPSEAYSPPSAHAATRHGRATRNGGRGSGGAPAPGGSGGRAPGARGGGTGGKSSDPRAGGPE